VNGNHLSNDGAFIEKRRRGLARFLNAVCRHPILSQEQLVIMFLTVPTELAVWRKQATISVQDEFAGRALPPGLEDSLPAELEDLFQRTRSGVRRSAELYIGVCSIMDRLVKRSEGIAADHARIALSLTSLTEATADTYATDANEVPLVNDGLIAMSKHLRTSQTLMEDEARAWDEGVLEDLKRQRDALVSVRDLFDRRERLDRDNIPALERRIDNNETKLANLRAKPDGLIKPGEIERVVEAIIKVKPKTPPGLGKGGTLTCSYPTTGQGVDSEPAQPLRLRQGVYPRRAHHLPVYAVPRLTVEPGLGPRARQVCGDAGG
jgi:sorting nexin-8